MTDDLVPASRCPWCSAAAPIGATQCPACGAALAQRESIAGLAIPGLTTIDPALQAIDGRPIHLRGPSPSQGMAPALLIGVVAGGPIGLAAIGGVAAVAGAEFLASRHGGSGPANLEDVGKPSEVLLQALEQERQAGTNADAGTEAGAGTGAGLGTDPASAPNPQAAAAAPDAAEADHGMSIWRDLPPEPEH